MSIGIKIKQSRRLKGLSQEKLGEQVGVSLKTIQRWENEERSPRMEEIKKIAEALNTSVEYLMGLTESEPQEMPLKQLLENSTKSLPINNDENKEKVKIKDPLFGTQWEYEPNKPPALDMAYWGGVFDNARYVANRGNEQEKAAALMMLRMAADAITGAGEKPITEKHGANIHADIIDNNGNVKQTISTVH